jgi:GT2 family glycosyltransferase
MAFGLDFAAPEAGLWNLEFQTDHVFRPSEWGISPDGRDLGFALSLISARRLSSADRERSQRGGLDSLKTAIACADLTGRALRAVFGRSRSRGRDYRHGLTVVIPERNNPDELSVCLEALWRARAAISEPVQVVVVVNGSKTEVYADLRVRFSSFDWIFHPWPLGFAEAVYRGLSIARYQWTYLLNSDVALEERALANVLRERNVDVFAVGSHILLKDTTRFREETNLTRWRINDGLIEAHDVIPDSGETCESAYVGGGASLFRTQLLRQYVRASRLAYRPFYWEDVEWGWRARKAGWRVLFCPTSVARHTQRATISRYYSAEEIELITERNRLLFQLRNVTGAGSVDCVLEAVARLPEENGTVFASTGVMRSIAISRLWNHLAPATDESLLA